MATLRRNQSVFVPQASVGGISLCALLACGPPAVIGPEANEPSTEPEAQGVEAHRKDAKLEVARINAHREKYDPHARETQRRCDPERANLKPGQPICWFETLNPTAVHLKEIQAHRLHAAHHRRAARRLSAAEERACENVAEVDRDESPFSHSGNILGVARFELRTGKKRSDKRLAGATVFFHPVPGLTTREFQRLLDCHIAQNSSIGYEKAAEEMPNCLLTQSESNAVVRKVPEGFAVDVQSTNDAAAHTIWQKAQTLALVKD